MLNGISIEFMECLNKDEKKKIRTLSVHQGRAIQISTSSILLDTKYEFYGFKKRPLTNEYHYHKAGFCKNKYRICCYAQNTLGSHDLFLNFCTLILLSLAVTNYHSS